MLVNKIVDHLSQATIFQEDWRHCTNKNAPFEGWKRNGKTLNKTGKSGTGSQSDKRFLRGKTAFSQRGGLSVPEK